MIVGAFAVYLSAVGTLGNIGNAVTKLPLIILNTRTNVILFSATRGEPSFVHYIVRYHGYVVHYVLISERLVFAPRISSTLFSLSFEMEL